MSNLEDLKTEYEELQKELMNPDLISDWERFQEVSKRKAHLEKIISAADELERVRSQIAENENILSSDEPELSGLAEQELSQLRAREEEVQSQLNQLLEEDSEEIPEAVILEIRPGTGGEEASLFASDLLGMYAKYAERNGWETEMLSHTQTEVGGLREAALEIRNKDAWRSLRYEGGVHRVQRIPETEKSGRIHTSTATVAVLPKATPKQVDIEQKDLKVEFTTSSAPGGQNVNKRQTAVRLTHIPSGLVVLAEASRTQQANKEAALSLIRSRLLEQQRAREEAEISGQRNEQIGSSERAEKIRTYNIPQDRITDHRIKESWHGIEKILREGNMDPIVRALQEQYSE